MTRYDDLSELKRMKLTNEQFEALCKLELMEAGVVIPATPEYEEVESVKVPCTTMHAVHYYGEYSNCELSVYFETAEQAMEVAAAIRGSSILNQDYKTNTRIPMLIRDVKVGIQSVHTEVDVAKIRARIIEDKEKKKRNVTLRNEYTKAVDSQDKILTSMRDDRYELQTRMQRYEKIKTVWEDYLATCNGDQGVALAFLEKAYNHSEIKKMNEWLGMSLPVTKEATDEDK